MPDATETRAREFRRVVDQSIRDFREEPAKARAFLIASGTHRENPETGVLELAPHLRPRTPVGA